MDHVDDSLPLAVFGWVSIIMYSMLVYFMLRWGCGNRKYINWNNQKQQSRQVRDRLAKGLRLASLVECYAHQTCSTHEKPVKS